MTPTFFIDRCLGFHVVPNALRLAGYAVETHDSHFSRTGPDEDWLALVGKRQWIAITKDRRILTRELSVANQHRVALFVLIARQMTGPQMAETIVKEAPTMISMFNSQARPFAALIDKKGVRIR